MITFIWWYDAKLIYIRNAKAGAVTSKVVSSLWYFSLRAKCSLKSLAATDQFRNRSSCNHDVIRGNHTRLLWVHRPSRLSCCHHPPLHHSKFSLWKTLDQRASIFKASWFRCSNLPWCRRLHKDTRGWVHWVGSASHISCSIFLSVCCHCVTCNVQLGDVLVLLLQPLQEGSQRNCMIPWCLIVGLSDQSLCLVAVEPHLDNLILGLIQHLGSLIPNLEGSIHQAQRWPLWCQDCIFLSSLKPDHTIGSNEKEDFHLSGESHTASASSSSRLPYPQRWEEACACFWQGPLAGHPAQLWFHLPKAFHFGWTFGCMIQYVPPTPSWGFHPSASSPCQQGQWPWLARWSRLQKAKWAQSQLHQEQEVPCDRLPVWCRHDTVLCQILDATFDGIDHPLCNFDVLLPVVLCSIALLSGVIPGVWVSKNRSHIITCNAAPQQISAWLLQRSCGRTQTHPPQPQRTKL